MIVNKPSLEYNISFSRPQSLRFGFELGLYFNSQIKMLTVTRIVFWMIIVDNDY